VVDFVGAVDLLRQMKREVEGRLGFDLKSAASSYPPGVPQAEVRATANVLYAAGLECTGLIDEPTAANQVLQVENGAIVDVGGGTTGIAILEDGKVVYTADEPTGGTHFSLVIAGALNVSFEQAEEMKKNPREQARLLPLVRPVMEKVGSIVRRHVAGRDVQHLYLVGGTCAYPGMDQVIQEYTGIPTSLPGSPLLSPRWGLPCTIEKENTPVMADQFSLRCYSYIDRMQPQYAAFVGTITQGDLPTEGMAALYIEVAPGNEVFRLVDIAVKATEAKPGAQIVEREFGMFEVHSHSQSEVLEAGRIVLDRIGLKIEDRVRPEIASVQIITNVDPYQAQLLNRFRRGSMLVPGETMLVLECAPAAYINYALNEAEKGSNIKVLHVSSVGRFGRMWLSGSEAEILTARNAAVTAIENLEGKTGK
jgi:ethanolamine utilization EutJ-like protein